MKPAAGRGARRAALAGLALACGCLPALAGPPASSPVMIAVFEFELVDASPAAVLLGKSTSAAATLDKVTSAARDELAHSGRYQVIDASKTAVPGAPAKGLRDCDGCEAALALQLGAEQSLLGIVQRATQTDYYVVIQIRDAHSGKLIDQQDANFAGSEDGWPSGVRMLIKHQVLATRE